MLLCCCVVVVYPSVNEKQLCEQSNLESKCHEIEMISLDSICKLLLLYPPFITKNILKFNCILRLND